MFSRAGPLQHDTHNIDPTTSGAPSYVLKPQLATRRAGLLAEIGSIDNDIANLQAVREGLAREVQALDRQLDSLSAAKPSAPRQQVNAGTSSKVSRPGPSTTDYTGEFEWSRGLKQKMRSVFGIQEFRLCQEGCVTHLNIQTLC